MREDWLPRARMKAIRETTFMGEGVPILNQGAVMLNQKVTNVEHEDH